ncbi:colicin E5-related ribonuclease [Novispirillum itersonii]
MRNNPLTGNRNDDPATAYINSDGRHVVRNDTTGNIVQL